MSSLKSVLLVSSSYTSSAFKQSMAKRIKLIPYLSISRSLSSSSHVKNYSNKIGFMFPGQGAQHVGMGQQLAREYPSAKQLFDRGSEIVGFDLLRICQEGPKDILDKTDIAQVALFVTSIASLEKLKAQDINIINQCSVAMGLSLGEYSALCFADAISFEDGVKLTRIRGECMQAASDVTPSGMVAIIGQSEDVVERLCAEVREKHKEEVLVIANYLAPGNIVVSGSKVACAAIKALAPRRSAIPLSVAGAFHSPLMQPASERLTEALKNTTIRQPRIPVMANVTARPHEDPESIRSTLVKQLTMPVLWHQTMLTMLESPDHERSYEIGPGTVCQGIIKRFESTTKQKFEVHGVQ